MPLKESAVPADIFLCPSLRMFIAAFTSLSRISPHSLQIHFLSFKVKFLFFHPHLLQVLLEGKNLFI